MPEQEHETDESWVKTLTKSVDNGLEADQLERQIRDALASIRRQETTLVTILGELTLRRAKYYGSDGNG